MKTEPAAAPTEEERYRALQELALDAPDARARLREGLHDGSWRVRRAASSRYAQLPDPARSAGELLEVLGQEGETGARNAAAEALALLGRPVLPHVLARLGHPDAGQRKFAADILGQVGLRETAGPLVEALQDVDPNVRLAAAEALGQVGGEAAVAALLGLLAGGEAALQLAALEGLAALRAPPEVARLVPLLEQPLLRRSALRLLALTGAPEAAVLACRLLGTGPTLERACLAALGELVARAPASRLPELERVVHAELSGRPPPVEPLRQALAGEGEAAARGAILVCRVLGLAELAVELACCAQGDALDAPLLDALRALGPEAAARLLPALERLPAPARERAGEVLVASVGPAHVPLLVALLASPDVDLVRLATRALAATGAPEALAPLVGLLGRPPQDMPAARALLTLAGRLPGPVREALAHAEGAPPTAGWVWVLAQVEGEAALPALRRALRDAAPEVRAAAAEAAGEVGGEAAREVARVALADEAPEVRLGAVRGLARLPGAVAEPLLAVAFQDGNALVRLAAIDAAGRSGARGRGEALARLVSHPCARTAAAAVRALGRLDWLDGELLGRAAAHPDPEVVKEALVAGAHLAGAEALARELLGHPRWDVRAAAARLLTAHGGPSARAVLDAALARETDGLVRSVLEEARRRLGRG